jgi:hypothetical protein
LSSSNGRERGISCPPITYPRAQITTLALRVVGSVFFKDIISGFLNYVEQNGYLKILTGRDLGNGGRGRDVSCLEITFGY